MTGQLMLRIKRYHYLGTLATALLVIGTYLMSQISTDTQQFDIVRNLVIIGFGVGITFPLYLNSVQSAVEPRFIGVVTSQIQFFRNVGATIGVAVLRIIPVTAPAGEHRGQDRRAAAARAGKAVRPHRLGQHADAVRSGVARQRPERPSRPRSSRSSTV